MKPADLAVWLRALPPDVDELRVMAGASKSTLTSVGSVAVKPTTIATAAAEVEAILEAADAGDTFRIFCFAGSKVVRTGLFSPGPTAQEGQRSTQEAMLAAGPVTSLEDALWRVSVAHASMIDRILASNERLVSGLSEPLTALAGLFNAETARRHNAEDRAAQLAEENMELSQLGRALGDRLEQTGEGDDGGKQAAILELVQAITGAFQAQGQGGGRRPAEPPKD